MKNKIVGDKVILRKFFLSDSESLLNVSNRKELEENLPDIKGIKKIENDERYIKDFIRVFNKYWGLGTEYTFAIADKKSNKVVGLIGLYKVKKNKKAEAGYWVAKKFQKKGFAYESLKLILGFAFNELKLKEVYAEVNSVNISSIKILEKNNFELIKKIKRSHKISGKWTDQLFYSISNRMVDNNLKIKVRKAKEEDYIKIARANNKADKMFESLFDPKEYEEWYVKWSVKELKSKRLGDIYLVAEIGNQIVGFISAYKKKNNVVWVSMLTVWERYRGKGVGRIMMKDLEKRSLKMGAKAIVLETQKKADWAVGFYDNIGYKRLSWDDLNKKPFKGTLEKPPVKHTYVFGKILK